MRDFSPVVPFCGKVGHPSRRVALENLWRVQKYLLSKSKDLMNFHVYRCVNCDLYHTGNTTGAAPVAPKPAPKKRRPSDARRKACEYDPDSEGDV